MLGGPAVAGLAAVVVGPDDLVAEVVAAEDFVEQDLGVVRLAGVEMEEERAGGGEEAVSFEEARAEEGEVVVEGVGVVGRGVLGDFVAGVAEAVAGFGDGVCGGSFTPAGKLAGGPARRAVMRVRFWGWPVLKGGSM